MQLTDVDVGDQIIAAPTDVAIKAVHGSRIAQCGGQV